MPMGLSLTSKQVLRELVRRKEWLDAKFEENPYKRAVKQERDALIYAIHLVEEKVAEFASKHED